MTDRAGRLARQARGWDEATAGYEAYYVPRFAPWVASAVRAVTVAPLPGGPVLVPCCGPFPGARHAGRAPARPEIIGMDLSAGMVRRARERAARHPRASVVHGDATTLHASWPRSCAAVVSVFGLQQLPEPDLAIRSWVTALRPGGRLLVVCWPDVTEPAGPFALMAEVVRAHAPSEDSAWERLLAPAAAAAGAVVERDEPVSHRMSHPDAAAFFDAHTHSAPLRPLATARGPAFVERLRAEFLCRSPAGEWHHRPSARHLLARATARDRSDRTDEQA